MMLEHEDHMFMKCIKTNLSSRYYRGEDHHKFTGINVAVFGIGAIFSHGDYVALPTEQRI